MMKSTQQTVESELQNSDGCEQCTSHTADIVYHGLRDVGTRAKPLTPASATSLSFYADQDAPIVARQLVRDFAATTSLRRAAQLRVELVVEELVMNTLEHGAAPLSSTIDLQLSHVGQGEVAIAYSDAGQPFDPTTMPSLRTVDPLYIGGLGWELIHGLCKSVQYARRANRNELSLSLDFA